MNFIHNRGLETTISKLLPHLPGASELLVKHSIVTCDDMVPNGTCEFSVTMLSVQHLEA